MEFVTANRGIFSPCRGDQAPLSFDLWKGMVRLSVAGQTQAGATFRQRISPRRDASR